MINVSIVDLLGGVTSAVSSLALVLGAVANIVTAPVTGLLGALLGNLP